MGASAALFFKANEMGGNDSLLIDIFHRLLDHFGPQHWWPVEDPASETAPFEIAAGAILTQNTNWKNVESALENLKAENLLMPRKIDSLPVDSLSPLIRPAGYFRVKARRLKNYARYLMEGYSGDVALSLVGDLDEKREELLNVNGIGPETADSILLYAGGRPIFVIDAYTKRILARHGIAADDMRYDDYQSIFHDALLGDDNDSTVWLFNEYHALLVACGKHYCRPKNLRCDICPLKWDKA